MTDPWPELDPRCDGLHTAGSDPWWREGWYFEFYDANAELQFQAYQGVFPNAASGDLNAAVFHRGKRVHQLRKMDFNVPAEPEQERLCFGPMKLEEIKALQQWCLRYDTVEFYADLSFTAVHPPFSWAAAKLWLETSTDPQLDSHHFDQLGRYTGSVWIDGRELGIDALGFRDRMWGWGGRKYWQSYLIMWAAFSEDCVANVAIQRFDGGRQSLAGYLHLDGISSLLQRATVEVDWHPHRWKTVACVSTRLQDALGRSFEFTGRPLGTLATAHRWPQRNDHMLFSVGEYRHGDLKGHGVMNWAFASQADQFQRLEAATK
ncbi:MAG: hypothetical protein ACC642_07710 [Pseudomonadales bacterium]